MLKDKISIVRKGHLAEKIVIIDGQPGCGKTMLSPIVASLDRVELLTYAYELEYICALYFLKKIKSDAAETMVRLLTDLQLYNTMMSREINFRPSDLSSIFKDANTSKYLKRLFRKGDENIPDRIKKEKPILHLTTHNLLPFCEPILSGIGHRVVFIEVVRHPLYMLKQQSLNMKNLVADVRDFTIYFNYRDINLPFYVKGFEDVFINASPIEKPIYCMEYLSKKANHIKNFLAEKFNVTIITIPFELFVVNPWSYMQKITSCLSTKIINRTKKMMKKQKVPRKMYADGVDLKIYKRCGWEPPKDGSNENKEFESRRLFAEKNVSKEVMSILNKLCFEYENSYLGGSKRKGDRYE